MQNFNHIKSVFFIGIGGIGMSALARYFHAEGKLVGGYDKTRSPVTHSLEQLGIEIVYNDHPNQVPEVFSNMEYTLIVFTPAVPKGHQALRWFQETGFTVKKRAEVLGILTRDKTCLAVAGTHGKTTTSSLLGHLLAESDVPVTAFLGGIAENYQSNLIQKGNEVIVVEADEFDRSFLQLHPDIACITSMDADHLDIYGEAEKLQEGFRAFAQLLTGNKTLITLPGVNLDGITAGYEDASAYSAKNVKIVDGQYHFDLKHPAGMIEGLQLLLPGKHNVLNAVTAMAMALEYFKDEKSSAETEEKLRTALASFSGVHRRFSYRIKRNDLVLIDDYAHHPTEINAVHQAVREMYPDDKILVVFQPHLFSRTRDFMDDFAKSLAQFDELLLLDIYPAREEPIDGITSYAILEQINAASESSESFSRKRVDSFKELPEAIKKSKARIKVLLGAGDIGEQVEKIINYLNG
ncbi:MAG: UDP-N-acetylmuramate--L-alanine ligase [Leeuwenhoekiella sp.]